MDKKTEALKLALKALEGLINRTSSQSIYSFMETERRIAMSACVGIREALAQSEQEPVALREALASALTSVYVCGRVWSAWGVGTMSEDDFIPASECDEVLDALVSAVTTPPQRTWVGLTDEDLSVCDEDGVVLARYWEAKLKEKNT